jgi:phytanoyl-CoA hydroxylase
MLTKEQIRQYEEEGYLILPNVYDAALVQRMRTVVDGLVENSREAKASDKVYDLAPTHSASRPRVRRIKNPVAVDPVFQEVVRHPNLIAILRQLIGPNIRLRNSKLNLKEAHHGDPVEWHQDWAFYPHTNQDVLAVGVMLDDCQLENGPLLVIPGSHKDPIYNHHSDGYFCGAMDPSRCDVDFSKAVPCTAPAGSISIHHARTVHGSAENTSTHPRRLLLYEITAADAWPLLGVPNLEEYDGRIIAGEPTLQPRLESVPVILPLPPAPNQGSIYENQSSLKNRFFGASMM